MARETFPREASVALEVGTINRDTNYPFNDTGSGLAFAIYSALKARKYDPTKRDTLPTAQGTIGSASGTSVTGIGTPARITGAGGTFAAATGEDKITLAVTTALSYASQVITLSGASLAEYITAINAQLVGAVASELNGQLAITSTATGLNVTLAVRALAGATQQKTGLRVTTAQGGGTTFYSTFTVGNLQFNRITINGVDRRVVAVASDTSLTVDSPWPWTATNVLYSTYNPQDAPPSYYSGTVAQWNTLTALEQWRVNVDYSANSQLDGLVDDASAYASGIVPYFVAQAQVTTTVAVGGLQNLPTLVIPGQPTDPPTNPVVLSGTLT